METPETITATEASRAFSEMLHRVCYGGESFIIKKGNRLMARIIPVEQKPAPEIAKAAQTDGLTQEEADYYQTVIAQLNKMVPEPCE